MEGQRQAVQNRKGQGPFDVQELRCLRGSDAVQRHEGAVERVHRVVQTVLDLRVSIFQSRVMGHAVPWRLQSRIKERRDVCTVETSVNGHHATYVRQRDLIIGTKAGFRITGKVVKQDGGLRIAPKAVERVPVLDGVTG